MTRRTGSGRITRRAHRIAYELLIGPIAKGLVLDHLCRNPGCVNPDHLDPVTSAENTRRGHMLKSDCPSGHPLSGLNLAMNSRGHRTCRECGRKANRKAYARKAASCLPR